MTKISIRFFDTNKVRIVLDDESKKWWIVFIDIVSALSADTRNYWYVLKNRLKNLTSKSIQIVKG